MTEHKWLDHYPEGVDWNAPIPAKPLYALMDDAVARFPQRPCLDFLGRIFTYFSLEKTEKIMYPVIKKLQNQ